MKFSKSLLIRTLLGSLAIIGGGSTLSVLVTSCELDGGKVLTDVFNVKDDHIITGFKDNISFRHLTAGYVLNFHELGIDQIGDDSLESNEMTGFTLSPYTSINFDLKTNSDQIVKFYSMLSSFSLENVNIVSDLTVSEGYSSGSYLFYGVNFSNLSVLSLENSDWAYSASENAPSEVKKTLPHNTLNFSGYNSFANCQFPNLLTLNLNGANFSHSYMGYAQTDVSSGYGFFAGSDFGKLQNISLENTKFADGYMNAKAAIPSRASTADHMFADCIFESLSDIDFSNCVLAQGHMVSAYGGRYCYTASHMFDGASFLAMTSLSFAGGCFAVDNLGPWGRMNWCSTASHTFDSAVFPNLTNIDFSDVVFNGVADNTAFAEGTFASAEFDVLEEINFRDLTQTTMAGGTATFSTVTFPVEGILYTNLASPYTTAPVAGAFGTSIPSGWTWTTNS